MSYIKRIQVSGLRNLKSVSLTLSPFVNVFYGENGSGKTSLLEALTLLGHGRSFRSHKTRSLISIDEENLTVFGELSHAGSSVKVGFQKSGNGKTLIRINGETARTSSQLAKQLPLQIINADSFQLIEGAPLRRRHFIDWLVFHVKPEFISVWTRLQRVIKQRNSLLRRDKIERLDLAVWDQELLSLAKDVDEMRATVFHLFSESLRDVIKDFSTEINSVEISYLNGWPESTFDYKQALDENFLRDVRDGYTHVGPHRADLKFSMKGKPVAEMLSRGQEKSLVSALHIAQAKVYKRQTQNPCVFLVDDLMAELDESNAKFLTKAFIELGSQVFVTGIVKEQLIRLFGTAALNEKSLFHVKQGHITEFIH